MLHICHSDTRPEGVDSPEHHSAQEALEQDIRELVRALAGEPGKKIIHPGTGDNKRQAERGMYLHNIAPGFLCGAVYGRKGDDRTELRDIVLGLLKANRR